MNQVTNIDINESGLPLEAFRLPTPPEHELNWWLNPDGTITDGGPAGNSAILPLGVIDTERKGIFLEGGTIAIYEPGKPYAKTLDGNFLPTDIEPPPNTWALPREWFEGSEIGILQGIQDVVLATAHQVAANANNTQLIPDFDKVIKYGKGGPLILIDYYLTEGEHGTAAALAKTLAVTAGGIAIAAAISSLVVGTALAGTSIVLPAAIGAGTSILLSVGWEKLGLSQEINELVSPLPDSPLDFLLNVSEALEGPTDWVTDFAAQFADSTQDIFTSIQASLSNIDDWANDLYADTIGEFDINELTDALADFFQIDGVTPSPMETLIRESLLSFSQSLTSLGSLFSLKDFTSLSDSFNEFLQLIDTALAGPRDPLVLDLDGDGVETISSDVGILFDHDADGIKHGTGWVSEDDGLLVWDINGNGVIDNGRELFGDNHYAHGNDSNPLADHGFEALGFYDLNQPFHAGDGVIDAEDSIFDNLQVWRDLNQDGISQTDELFSLASLGITSISLDNQQSGQQQEDNIFHSLSSFSFEDGRQHDVAALFLSANMFNNQFPDSIPLTEQTESLPNFDGTGGLRSLQEAATLDTALLALMEQFAEATTRVEQDSLVDAILWQWHLSSATDTLYQSGWQYSDGIKSYTYRVEQGELTGRYSIIEAISGRQVEGMIQTSGGGGGGEGIEARWIYYFFPTRPLSDNSPNKAIQDQTILAIENAYQQLKNHVLASLTLQTRLKPIADAIDYSISTEGIIFDFSEMESLLLELVSDDTVNGVANLLDFVGQYGGFLFQHNWNAAEFVSQVNEYVSLDNTLQDNWHENLTNGTFTALRNGELTLTDVSNNPNILIGNSEDNTLSGGNSSDIIDGGVGDDDLNGGHGNDYLSGNAGNDRIEGEDGNDTIDGGNGNDHLFGGRGNDKINGRGGNDIIYGNEGNDKINGHNGNDQLYGNDGNDRINGQNGDDTLNGGSGKDRLNGGNGRDILLGGEGNDVLRGGKGEGDHLSGGAGNDIYQFAKGEGNTIIDNFNSQATSIDRLHYLNSAQFLEY